MNNSTYISHKDWILALLKHIYDDDSMWIVEHKDEIALRLPTYINDIQWANSAINSVNFITPLFLEIYEYKKASELVETALESPFMDNIAILELELEQHFGTAELQRGHVNRAEELLFKNLRRLDTSKQSIELLRIYVNLVRLRVYRQEFAFDEKLLDEIILMGRRLHFPMGDIYATVALAYFGHGMEEKMQYYVDKANREYAIDYGEYPEASMLGIAQMYFHIAITQRVTNKIELAEKNLLKAADAFAKTSYHMQYVNVLYETAQIYICKGKYKIARQWIDKAIEEYYQHPDPNPYHEAMLEHSKGLILYYLRKYSTAVKHFHNASISWNNMHHTYNYALSLNALGSAQIKLERPLEAINNLQQARGLCATTDNAYATRLLDTIDININDAKNLLNHH